MTNKTATKEKREWSVVWQREAPEPEPGNTDPDAPYGPLSVQRRIYQTKHSAKHWMLLLEGRYEEATGRRAEDRFCCDAEPYCGAGDCTGQTNGERWAERHSRFGRLIFARIEERNVGEWERISQ